MPTNEDLQQQLDTLRAQLDAITTPSHAELVNRMAALLATWQAREDQMRNWLGGSATGGPNSDGLYPLTDASGFTRLTPTPALIAASARAMASPADITANTTLTAAHNGQRLRVGGSNNITLTLPNGLPKNWNCLITRIGTGTVVLAASAGATLANDQSFDRLRARYSVCTVFVDTVTGGSSAYIASGSMVQA